MLADYAGRPRAGTDRGDGTSARAAGAGFTVQTDQGTWHAPTVVLACGAAAVPAAPGLAGRCRPGSTQVTPAGYRNPGQLPDGACGDRRLGERDQLAAELHRSG